MSETPTIRIRGIREGLLITLAEGDFADLLAALETELAAKADFLQGSRVTLEVGARPLDQAALSKVQRLLLPRQLELWAVLAEEEATREAARGLGLATRQTGSNRDLDGNVLAPAGEEHTPPPPPPTPPATLYLKETIRSGRSIYHEGSVLIVGDVNAGAEIIAGGDVIVWGRLRGLVHAGALGNTAAIICALELSPTQLRIADQIAVPPDNRRRQPLPEIAAIRQGQIVADPWRTTVHEPRRPGL
ncbi:MAG: septum site-determining protein MinC [Ardenticatenaceae bacterium]|nr:septum site-determining protein MinC [Ardenticatenaceae bacterium]